MCVLKLLVAAYLTVLNDTDSHKYLLLKRIIKRSLFNFENLLKHNWQSLPQATKFCMSIHFLDRNFHLFFLSHWLFVQFIFMFYSWLISHHTFLHCSCGISSHFNEFSIIISEHDGQSHFVNIDHVGMNFILAEMWLFCLCSPFINAPLDMQELS